MLHKVLQNRTLRNAFVLRLERNDLEFIAGQHVNLQIESFKRPYSIYSGEREPYLEFLIKEIEKGDTSPRLRALKSGDYVDIEGPEGQFTIDNSDLNKKFYFICTGSGIAPFHSFIKTYPSYLDYTIVHGTKTAKECYDSEDYDMYIHYSSHDDAAFQGRVTDYFKDKHIDKSALYYLCGLGKMIYDMDKILTNKGVPTRNIFWEVYHAERI